MPNNQIQKATFGAGCFWHIEDTFSKVLGVISTCVGYSGGHFQNPTYKDVCTGTTGHAEVVQIEYDPSKITFEKLLQVFWELHDPTQLNKQGPDIGTQYRSAIFYHTEEQETVAKVSKENLDKSGKYKNKIVTQIELAKELYKAEEYHQKYFEKSGGASNCIFPDFKL